MKKFKISIVNEFIIKIILLFTINLFLISCTTYNHYNNYDDVYFSLKKDNPVKSENYIHKTNDSITTYVTNNYYDNCNDYDYTYRLRRFHSPYIGYGYYSPYYTNVYYNPNYYYGIEFYLGRPNVYWYSGWYYPHHYSYNNFYRDNYYHWSNDRNNHLDNRKNIYGYRNFGSSGNSDIKRNRQNTNQNRTEYQSRVQSQRPQNQSRTHNYTSPEYGEPRSMNQRNYGNSQRNQTPQRNYSSPSRNSQPTPSRSYSSPTRSYSAPAPSRSYSNPSPSRSYINSSPSRSYSNPVPSRGGGSNNTGRRR